MSSTSTPPIHKRIGVAVIKNQQGEILIDRRRKSGEMGGLWEFPGGKIEPGETIEECIEREVHEELAIQISVGDRLSDVSVFVERNGNRQVFRQLILDIGISNDDRSDL